MDIISTIGKTPKSAEIPPIAPNWAYLQLETCSKEEETKPHQLQELFGGTSLFNRLEIKSAWQLRLESLLAENQTEDVQEGETEYNTKLIYILRYGIIVPILKRKLKNGSWSVGRELSIRSLRVSMSHALTVLIRMSRRKSLLGNIVFI